MNVRYYDNYSPNREFHEEIEIIEKNQVKILKLKSTKEVKISLKSINSRFELAEERENLKRDH